MDIQKVFGHAKGFVKLKLPTILSAFAATTSVGAIFLAVKADRNAQDRLHEAGTVEETDLGNGMEYVWTPPVKKVERRIYADEFMPVVIVETLAVAAIFGAEFDNQKRIAGLANALGLATSRLDILERKIEEKFGKEKKDEIMQEIKEDGVDQKLKEFDHLPEGVFLFKDPWYNRFFVTSEKNFLRAVNSANSIFEAEGYVTLGTFYYYLDIKAPEASLVEGFTWEQVVEDWGECKIPISHHIHRTKAGAAYFEIEYNCDVKTVLTSEDVIIAHYG